MRILAFGDVHDKTDYYKSVEEKIRKFKPGLVIGVGDIVNYKKLADYLVKPDLDFEFIFVHGNNDNLEDIRARIKENDFMSYLSSEESVIANLRFLGIGGVVGSKERNFSLEYLRKVLNKSKTPDVLITHADPGSRAGDLLKKFVLENSPRYWFHGHDHEGAGRVSRIGTTFVINASRPVITDLKI